MSTARLAPWILLINLQLTHADSIPSPNSSSSPLILQEILTRNVSFPNAVTGQTTDWVELQNRSHSNLSLSGYFLTDDPSQPQRWPLPAEVTLVPQQTVVVDLDGDFIPTLLHSATRRQWTAPFSLNSSGDALYLFRETGSAQPMELVDEIQFGPQVPNFSLGRSSSDGDWTLCIPTPYGANTPATLGSNSQLTINEWMAAPYAGEDWIELHNASPFPVSLEGIALSDSDSKKPRPSFGPYSYIGTENHGFVIVWADDSDIPGHTHFKLNSQGETIRLLNGQGKVLNQVQFGNQAPGRSEGRMPDGAPSFRRLVRDGTPGLPNAVSIEGIQFSEILSHTDDPLEDAIEIQNLRAESVDLSGWYLSDNPTVPQKYRIPDGTVVDPGGFAVFYRYQFQPRPGIFPSFGFNSAHGDDLYLFSLGKDNPGAVGRIKSEFASAPNGYSFGTHLTSVGFQLDLMSAVSLGTSITATNEVNQTPLFRLGRGATNPPALMTPLAISEIAAGQMGGMDFIEIRSLVTTNVTFYDLVFPTNTYTLRGSVRFSWPPQSQIQPGESVIIVGFDPRNEPIQLERFRQKFGMDANIQIFGPYEGTLKGSGGEIRLYRPDIPQFCFDPDFGFVAPILVDRVHYTDDCPWPRHVGNLSLQRTEFTSLGDDPVYWRTGQPSPGSETVAWVGVPPRFQTQVVGEARSGERITFKIIPDRVGDDRSWCIQWRFNGELLDQESRPALMLEGLNPRHSGLYTAVIQNDAGATRVDFPLTVHSAPIITKSPESMSVAENGTALLSVCAQGTPPFTYIWSRDGHQLAAQTNATLVLSNLSAAETGEYSVKLMTRAGAITSAPVRIDLLHQQSPQVVVEPAGLDFREVSPIREGSSFRMRVVASGTPPLQYQWLRNGIPIPNAQDAEIVLPHFSEENVGAYEVLISNPHGTARSRRVPLQVLVLPSVQIKAPDEIIVHAGDNVSFTTEFKGTPRLYYQWSWNGRDIPAELCKDFTRFGITHSQAGTYQVRCWNKQGEVILGSSTSQVVRVIVQPRITSLQRFPDHRLLSFQATPGERYTVEGSSNFQHWETLTHIEALNEDGEVKLPLTERDRMFIRLRRE